MNENPAAVIEPGYCFACRTRTTFSVIRFEADGQEETTCQSCGATGYGPAVPPAK